MNVALLCCDYAQIKIIIIIIVIIIIIIVQHLYSALKSADAEALVASV